MNVGHYDKAQARAYDLKARLIQLWRHTTDVDLVIKEIAVQIREAVIAEYEGEDSPVSRIEHAAYDSGYSRATEEAAKIACEISFTHCAPGEPCTGIGQAIREAVEIAEGAVGIKERAEWSMIMKLAVADAYEDAAKIAENYFGKGINAFADKIAEKIRARAKETK